MTAIVKTARALLAFGSAAAYLTLLTSLRQSQEPVGENVLALSALVAVVCLILRGLLPGGFLRSLGAAASAPAGSALPLPTSFRRLRTMLATAAGLFVLVPLVLPKEVPFNVGRPLNAGVVIALAAAELYAALATRGLFGLPDTRGRRLAGTDVALLVLLPLYLLSIANGELLTSGDNKATRLLGPLLVHERSLDLSRLPEFQRDPKHYSAVRVGERLLPSFPLGTGILTVPYALIASRAYGPDYPFELVDRWEKHVSALFLVASAAALFLALRRRWGDGPALATTLVFAFATAAFSCVGQALYSTTGEVLLLALALTLLVPPGRGTVAAAGAGLALGGAFLCRPTALLPAAALGLWLLPVARRRLLPPFLATFAVSVGAVVVLHVALYGNVLGGYGLMNLSAGRWGKTLGEGLLGVLVSPSRGAFVWFPYLLAVPLGLGAVRRDSDLKALSGVALLSVLANLGLAAGYDKWWGGYSFGPRLTTEVAPFLALLTLPLWLGLRRLPAFGRAATLLLVAAAAGTQVLGAYSRPAIQWNGTVSVDRSGTSLWSVRDSQILAAWWSGWYPSWKAPAKSEIGGAAGEWVWVDFSPSANSRYDRDPFIPDPKAPSWPHYPDLDPSRQNQPDTLFHILPKGRANAVTTCRGVGAFEIRLDPTPVRRVHVLVAAGASQPSPNRPVFVNLKILYADGTVEEHPLRLNEEVWEYHAAHRGAPVDPSRVYQGKPGDNDVLVKVAVDVGRPDVSVRGIRIENVPDLGGAGVALFALTLEKSPRPASGMAR